MNCHLEFVAQFPDSEFIKNFIVKVFFVKYKNFFLQVLWDRLEVFWRNFKLRIKIY